jgi:hypothetical protein
VLYAGAEGFEFCHSFGAVATAKFGDPVEIRPHPFADFASIRLRSREPVLQDFKTAMNVTHHAPLILS